MSLSHCVKQRACAPGLPDSRLYATAINFEHELLLEGYKRLLQGWFLSPTILNLDMNELLLSNSNLNRRAKRMPKKNIRMQLQLTIDNIILEQAKIITRNAGMVFIEYANAFHSLSHSWLIEVLRICQVHPSFVSFLETIMKRNFPTQLPQCPIVLGSNSPQV